MRPDHVPHEELRRADVPPADAPWEDIAEFGLTFHAYKVAGSVPRVSRLAAEDLAAWEEGDVLPEDLTRLRLDLFALVRSLGDRPPDPPRAEFARALLDAIRSRVVSGQ